MEQSFFDPSLSSLPSLSSSFSSPPLYISSGGIGMLPVLQVTYVFKYYFNCIPQRAPPLILFMLIQLVHSFSSIPYVGPRHHLRSTFYPKFTYDNAVFIGLDLILFMLYNAFARRHHHLQSGIFVMVYSLRSGHVMLFLYTVQLLFFNFVPTKDPSILSVPIQTNHT